MSAVNRSFVKCDAWPRSTRHALPRSRHGYRNSRMRPRSSPTARRVESVDRSTVLMSLPFANAGQMPCMQRR